MKFVTSAYLEVAVKLLVSATVKGFCFVEEKEGREIEIRRSRVREIQVKKIFLPYLMALSYFIVFLYFIAFFLV
jgi:hypothetical protein